MIIWLIVAFYVLMMVVTARIVDTDGSLFLYGLLWPVVWAYLIWRLVTGQFQLRFHGRVVYRGKKFR